MHPNARYLMMIVVAGASIAAAAAPAAAGPTAPALPPGPASYADVADVAVESATIVDATIRRAAPLDAARAPNVPATMVRLYVEAAVGAVIYGRNPVAPSVAYLVDLPRDAQGRPPRLSRQRVLLFARPVANASQLQLVRTTAQLAWTPSRDQTTRAIAAELATGTVPPEITGVAQAFTVPGTIAGESETQIFLRTANAQPVSLSILRRPGQAARWAVAFGEIVDESAAVPAPRTLGWYRLACGLPRRLPASAVSRITAAEARAVADDYMVVLNGVGPCDRTAAQGQ